MADPSQRKKFAASYRSLGSLGSCRSLGAPCRCVFALAVILTKTSCAAPPDQRQQTPSPKAEDPQNPGQGEQDGTAATGDWRSMTKQNAPTGRANHTAVWTGRDMIVWGGRTAGEPFLGDGAAYRPETKKWKTIESGGAPQGRHGHTATWLQAKMIVWGGMVWDDETKQSTATSTGAVYEPATGSWSPISTKNAPQPRSGHSAIAANGTLVIWGGTVVDPAKSAEDDEESDSGNDGSVTLVPGNGAIYDPLTDHWTATATLDAPTSRYGHISVWTGDRMVVWGGVGTTQLLNDGAAFDPAVNTWKKISNDGAPTARRDAKAVWIDNRLVLFGGLGRSQNADEGPSSEFLADGGIYLADEDRWIPLATNANLSGCVGHSLTVAEARIILYGGHNDGILNHGALWVSPATDSQDQGGAWAPVNAKEAGSRTQHSAIFTGQSVIVWGGYTPSGTYTQSGAHYFPPK